MSGILTIALVLVYPVTVKISFYLEIHHLRLGGSIS